jgi:crotonobetainyl-CoA:carnitine CoA-transferase CaiB-like acyl-CoA transferase
MTSTSPLSGFVVVELGHNVAGPVGGQILAELGAKVVKVEDPGKGESFKGRCHGGFQRCNPIGRPESAHPE